MSVPVIVVVLVGGASAFLANMISFLMITKINECVPENQRISYLRWGTEVRKRYREFFPGSKLPFLVNVCVVLMLVSFALGVKFWVFGSAPGPN
jgi:hypothetical protein